MLCAFTVYDKVTLTLHRSLSSAGLLLYFIQLVCKSKLVYYACAFNRALSLCVSCLEGLGVENTAVPAVQCGSLHCSVQCSIVQCNALQCSVDYTTLHYTTL